MSEFSESPSSKGTEGELPNQVQSPYLITGQNPRERWMTILTAAIVAALMTIVLVFGFQAFQANWTRQEAIGPGRPGTLVQNGTAVVRGMEPVQVFYPVPYESPPLLNLTGIHRDSVVVVDQKPDHFSLRKDSSLSSVDLEWRAEGRPKK